MVFLPPYKPVDHGARSLDDQPDIAIVLAGLRALMGSLLQQHVRKLPPERDLAQQFSVGRGVVRKALAILEEDGAVVRHVGRGTFITSSAGSTPPQLQALALGGALAIDGSSGLSLRDLIEIRFVLEPTIAEIAALSALPEEVEYMQECMRRREESQRLDAYEHWDYELHMAIATATHNKLLIEMLDLVNRLRRSSTWRKFRAPSIDPVRRHTSNLQHQTIVQAISQADSAAAFTSMRAHIGHVSGAYQVLFPDEPGSAPPPPR